jgi:hypothetical protein
VENNDDDDDDDDNDQEFSDAVFNINDDDLDLFDRNEEGDEDNSQFVNTFQYVSQSRYDDG